jgi:hypothetical protein
MSNENPNQPTHRARPYEVTARKIGAIVGNNTGGGVLLQLTDGSTYVADTAMTARHFPASGDYLIIGEDGFPYLNTASVFERKYEPIIEQAEGDIEFTTCYGPGDFVMFQPNIEAGYCGAVRARVVRGYLDGTTVRYDIEVPHWDGADESWRPLRGVDSLMLLSDIDAAVDLPQMQDSSTELRALCLDFAVKAQRDYEGIVDLIAAAKQMEAYITGAPTANPTGPLATKPDLQPPASARIVEITPNDGPRVTPDSVTDEVQEEYYFTGRQVALSMGMTDHPELERLTVCILLLRSGAMAVGYAIVVSLENFDENAARKQAYRSAMCQLTDLLGFQMKQRLFEEEQRNAGLVHA